ncbi:LysR family transcriptional regulator [Vibrio sp. 10N.261.51.F12]|uniref:LysR family transcriptional regulator n=1 Tax=Vibrio sp. 10N.261.51.F12 TaxID=3229679 RepID=UPI00354C6078
MIKPDLLKCFIAAADSGSFSAAGRLLGKHLATISGNIARLEDELGVLLFDREGKYPQLTDAGRSLYDGAKVAVDSIERFTRNAQQLSMGIPAHFTVAIDENIDLMPFGAIFSALQRQWPDLKLSVLSLGTQEILDRTRSQHVDFALTPSVEGNSQFYEFRAIGYGNIDIVCGHRHPLAKRRHISNDDLLAHTQVIGSSILENKILHDSFKMSSSLCETNGYANLLALIKAGLGWGFLVRLGDTPQSLVTLQPEFAQTQLQLQYDVIWPKNQSSTDIHQFLLEQIESLFKSTPCS